MSRAKLISIYSFRITPKMKEEVENLSPILKSRLNEQLRLTLARVLHEASFDPKNYLKK